MSAFLDHDTRFGAVLLRAFSIQHSGLPAEVRSYALCISGYSDLFLVMSIIDDQTQWSTQRHLAQQPICAFMISASLRVLTLRIWL